MRFNDLPNPRLLRGDAFAFRTCRARSSAFFLTKRMAGVGSIRRPVYLAFIPGGAIARRFFFTSDGRNSLHLPAGLRLADLRFPLSRP